MERRFVGRTLGLAIFACGLLGGMSAASANIVIETVPVGNVGNAADTTGYGAVGYAYNIGKYEVTNGQYTSFLNAVAATDTYGLYNSFMSITQSGSPGAKVYGVDSNLAYLPVVYVSFWDACRFANWLQNGQPIGAQVAGITETGAYTLTTDGIANNTITRNTGTTWALVSENEWYKAAYYKSGSTTAGYWLYATKNDAAPGWDTNDVSGNNANYWVAGRPMDTLGLAVVGEFQNSASPYGTFDQTGNVGEWTETIMDDPGNPGPNGFVRCERGGGYTSFDWTSNSGWRGYGTPSYSNYPATGFRVVQVPEPVSLGVLGIGVIGMLLRRRSANR